MNNVNIIYSPSGLGSPAVGEDFISGMIFYGATAATSPTLILSVSDVEGLGYTTGTSSSYNDYIHYHVSEYFRANPTGNIYFQVINGTASTYSELTSLQNFSLGKLRQCAIFDKDKTFNTLTLPTIQTQIDGLVTDNKPLEVIYQANFVGLTLSTLTDLNASNAKNISVCLGQDGAALGASLYTALGYTIGCAGLTLGAISSALVSTSIAWVQNFNMATTEMDTLAFGNGTLYTSLSTNAITLLDTKRYTFLRKFVGISGSYFNNDYTAITTTSDYSTVHLNRTIHKVAREVRSRLLPSISAPIYFNQDGTIALTSILFFKSEAETALSQMVTNSEISKYKVIINSAQNVVSTKTLSIGIEVIPVGVADVINVSVGFTLSI